MRSMRLALLDVPSQVPHPCALILEGVAQRRIETPKDERSPRADESAWLMRLMVPALAVTEAEQGGVCLRARAG
jgi:hypothetical protein